MGQPVFLIKDMVKIAWNKFKENPLPWIGALLFIVAVSFGEAFLQGLLFNQMTTEEISVKNGQFDLEMLKNNAPVTWGSLLLSLAFQLIYAGLSVGLVYMGIKEADGVKAGFADLFARFDCFLKYFLASLIYAIIVTLGFILLVVPGVIWAIKFGLFPFFIADKKTGPIEALKLSSLATYGYKWDLLKVWLLFILAFFVGALLLLLGLFVVIPVAMIAFALIYRRLTTRESYLTIQGERLN